MMSPEELKLFEEEKSKYKMRETGEVITFDWLKKIVSVYQERLKKLSEIIQLTDFFFRDKLEYDKSLLKWNEMEDREVKSCLDKLEKILSKIKSEDFNKENLEKILLPEAEKIGSPAPATTSQMLAGALRTGDRGYLLWPLRVALSGKEASAGPFEIAEILGREKTIKRIKDARAKL